jgi:hypothetical protein
MQILRQRRKKTTNAAPTTLSPIQAAANPLLSMHNYAPLVISRNEKNKQLTLLSQRKLALYAIKKLFIKSSGPLKFKNQPRTILFCKILSNFFKIKC